MVVSGGAGGFNQGIPNPPQWLTFTLSAPLHLDPNNDYGFQLVSDGTGGNDGFFIELDGTNTNPYAGGFALGTSKMGGGPDSALVFDGNNGQISDRAFVASMLATVPEPSMSLLIALGGIALAAQRQRRNQL